MARARNIKPGFYKNEDLAECSVWARFIYPGLWMLADRDGLLEDRPKRIKAEILPFDSVEIEPLLSELAARKLIVRYQNEDGSYIWIPKFKEHQSPHYSEKPSGIKPPALPESTRHDGAETPGKALEDSEKTPVLRGGRNPLNPDSLNPESRLPPPEDRRGKRASAERRQRLPEDFELTEARRAALLAQSPLADAVAEFDHFRDHHRAKGSTMLDWDAAWRTWCQNVRKFTRSSHGADRSGGAQSAVDRVRAATGQ